MRSISRCIIGLFLFFSVHMCADVHAADIRKSDSEICAFSLEGPIAAGDTDRLSQLISNSQLNDLDARTLAVCLKSNGGSYFEGLKLAELIYRTGLNTVVTSGSQCFSACAIIFMAGVVAEKPGTASARAILPYRRLSASGIVGFHAPFLSLPDEKYTKEQMEGAAQSMRTAILGLVKLSSKQTRLSGGDFIKKSLLEAVLTKGPQELLFVKTIGDAARWGIEIYDFAAQFPKPTPVDEIKNLCNNFHYSNMDEPVPRDVNLSLKVERYSSKFNRDDFRVLVRDGRTSDTVCEIYPNIRRGTPDVVFHACSYDYWSSKNFGDCREYKTALLIGRAKFVPTFFTLDPMTLLRPFRN